MGLKEEDAELISRTIEWCGPCPKCRGKRMPFQTRPLPEYASEIRCISCGDVAMSEDTKTPANDLVEIKHLAQQGRVELANPEAAERMMRARRESEPRDYTVTEVGIRAAWEHDGGKGVILTWGTVSAGFGELTLHIDEMGELTLDTETMGRKFAQAVFKKLVEGATVDTDRKARDAS